MVAFRRGLALTTTCFILGVIFLASPIIKQILFNAKGPSAADYERAERYFAAWWEAPQSVKMLLHADFIILLVACITKLVTWTEEAYYFDGASVVLCIFIAALYIASLVPGLRMLNPASKPLPSPWLSFFFRQAKAEANSLLHPGSADAVPPLTPPEREETMAIVAATLVLIAVLLIGIILLQTGEWYAMDQHRKLIEQSNALQQEAAAKKAKEAKSE